MKINDDGIIEIEYVHRFNDPKDSGNVKYVIDTSHGYHLVSYEGSQKKANGQSHWYKQELKWKKYGPTRYVSEASFEGRWTSSISGSNDVQNKSSLKVKVEIVDFEPNSKIDASEFEIEAMEIPLGTRVEDEITGLTYRYGGEIVTEKELARALEESELSRSDLPKVTSNSSDSSGTNGESKTSREDEVPESPNLVDESTGNQGGYVWYALGGAFLVVVVGYVIYKRARGNHV